MIVSSPHYPLQVEHFNNWGVLTTKKETIRFSSDPDGVYDQEVIGYTPLSRPSTRWHWEYQLPTTAFVTHAAAGME